MLFGGGCTATTAAGEAVCAIFLILWLAIFARILLSWIQVDPTNPMVQALFSLTEPILEPMRRIIPRIGMIDISPIATLFLLLFLSRFLAQVVDDLAS
jgi:YggT family protein